MKAIVAGLLLLACSAMVYGQRTIEEGARQNWMDRVYVGGGLGLNGGTDGFGNRFFYIGLMPIVGYMVTNQFSVGTGLTYQRYNYPDFNVTLTQYGASPFMRYNFNQLFLYSEYMLLNTPTFDNAQRRTFNRMLVGAGFSQPIGARRGAINAMALYDVLYNQSERAFASPWVFRVFFSF